MATSTVARAARMASPLILWTLALTIPFAAAQDAKIQSEDEVPDWVSDTAMVMMLSALGGEELAYQYLVVPLTETLDLNQTAETTGTVNIEGVMVDVNSANFESVGEASAKEVAYLSCDEPSEDGGVGPNEMVNRIIGSDPMAIVLYSTAGNGCTLEGTDLNYKSIFTMIDAGDAERALEFLNATAEEGIINVSISGNLTSTEADEGAAESGTSSAVAMSVLYSITGLVTILFLVIIATGTIRAHRYPERYGPRRAYGGRPRQSRAKGIARAVLDTLPIVKFGAQPPSKPDPDLESRDSGAESPVPLRTSSAVTEGVRAASVHELPSEPPKAIIRKDSESALNTLPRKQSSAGGDEHLGCSICTDDFTVGEDVRVLPCSHKFHPACVDPWLINVSGTCPLCRLDLRPPNEKEEGPSDEGTMPPPLDSESINSDDAPEPQSRRTSRLLDLTRLRHASAEERLQALRQYRHSRAQDASSTAEDSVDRSRRAKLADRLRERFRIRTRPQSPETASR